MDRFATSESTIYWDSCLNLWLHYAIKGLTFPSDLQLNLNTNSNYKEQDINAVIYKSANIFS